jgi:hypothetical protein
MEHLLHIVEIVLAAFGSMKFAHEVIEVVHYLAKLIRK